MHEALAGNLVELLSWTPAATSAAVASTSSSATPAAWDGRADCARVRAWPASAELRALHEGGGPSPLHFARREPAGAYGAPLAQALMQSASTWRFSVIADDRGVHVLDWLPRQLWPLNTAKWQRGAIARPDEESAG